MYPPTAETLYSGLIMGRGCEVRPVGFATIGLVTLNAEDDPFDIKDRPRMFEVA